MVEILSLGGLGLGNICSYCCGGLSGPWLGTGDMNEVVSAEEKISSEIVPNLYPTGLKGSMHF